MTLQELMDARDAGAATVRLDDVYDLLGVSRASAYRAAAAGEIPGAVRLGRRRLILVVPFVDWLLGQRPDPLQKPEPAGGVLASSTPSAGSGLGVAP